MEGINRQDMLLIWLRREGVNQADIARWLGVTETSVSRWLRAESIPVQRHGQLVELGIPAELLPAPVHVAPGPKKKSREI